MTRDSKDTWTSDALERGDVDAIRQRCVHDPHYIQSRDYLGTTPLLTAIGFDNLELVRFLLDRGADPNVAVDDGYTCLLTAVESDADASVDIVAALMAAGADIHQTGTNGWTPLHMAAACGHVEKARRLIDAGAKVNHRTEIDGQETPLMAAAFTGRPETVQLLLDHGADPSMRDTIQNRTALGIARAAIAGAAPEVYRFLKDETIQIDADEMFADIDLPAEQKAIVKQAIANVDIAETYLQNAKELAESGNHAEVIRILTEHAPQR